MARKPREFQPARKGRRRPAKEELPPPPPARDKRAQKQRRPRPEPVEELELVDSEEEVSRGQLESAIVVTTCLGLLIGIILSVIGLGRHYGYGPMSGLYEAPTATEQRDIGLPEIDLRVTDKSD